MGMTRIRHVLSEDYVEELTYLQSNCLPFDKAVPTDDPDYDWWLAEDGSEPIAFACFVPSVRSLHTAYFARSGVLPSARGNGLQKRLIRSRAAYAKRHGYVWAITDTTDNPASSNSLISCGFRLYQPAAPWAFAHSLYFRKKIA